LKKSASKKSARKHPKKTPDTTPQSDSTEGWGVGNTAVLEPPRKKEPVEDPVAKDDADGIDFPVGFPLRDFDDDDKPPEQKNDSPPERSDATEEQIAMLERMFGAHEHE